MPRAKGRETKMVDWNSICHSVDSNPICYPFGGNTRNTNLWDAITTRLGSLVYILTQTPASERTCTVHQVLVESLTACSDPGTCTAPGCLLDSKAIIASICKKNGSHEPIRPQICVACPGMPRVKGETIMHPLSKCRRNRQHVASSKCV